MYSSNSSNTHRHADLAALALALALALAVLAASSFPRSWMTKVLRMAVVVVWSCFTYFVSAIIPGCLWAPARL